MDSELIKLLPFLSSDDIEDLFLITIANTRDNVPRQTKLFKLENFSEEYCFLNFRFYPSNLKKLYQCLEIRTMVHCRNGTRVYGMEALCILLRRLAYPNGYVDLMKIFPRTRCELSRIFNHMVSFVLERYGHLTKSLNHAMLTMDYVERLANAVSLKGPPYKHCFGFLDGTVRAICRPKIRQRAVVLYNGHRRTHAQKFQSVMLPDGIIVCMYGPVHGGRHDAFILAQSNLLNELEARFYNPSRDPFFLYGDPAYPLRPHLIVPFKGHALTPAKRLSNKRMSSVRECVDWGFSKVIQNFAFLDFKKNLKIRKQQVERDLGSERNEKRLPILGPILSLKVVNNQCTVNFGL